MTNVWQVWFVLNKKRLFKAADDFDFPNPSPKSSEFPMMGPEELKTVLQNHTSYEELHAEFLAYYEGNQDLGILEKKDNCRNFVCENNAECRRRSTRRFACDNCHQLTCSLYWGGLPNYVGPSPARGKNSEE